MSGSNPFGALAMEDDNQAGPSTREVEGVELDIDWLKLVRTNHEVNIRVTDKVDLSDLPSECNLLVVSNQHDLLIVGGNSGGLEFMGREIRGSKLMCVDVRVHRLPEVMRVLEDAPKDGSPVSEPLCRLELPGRPIWIRLAMGEERLVVALEGGKGVILWKIQDILAGNITPYHTFTANLPSRLLDVLTNPASVTDQLARLVALIAPAGIVVADVEGCMLAEPFAGPFTSACWSAKGKQLVVGTPSGSLVQYTPNGTPKTRIPPPPSLEENSRPTSIQWLENDVFQVSYAPPESTPEDPLEVYIITRTKSPSLEYTYTKFYDPLDTMGVLGRSSHFRHYANLKSWGETTRHLSFMISGLASSIGVIHEGEAGWESLILEETGRGIMPVAKNGVRDDTSVLGLGLVLTGERPVKRGMEGGVEIPDLPPAPRLLAFSQEGFLVAYDVVNPEGGGYPGMVRPGSVGAVQEVGVDGPSTTAQILERPSALETKLQSTPTQPSGNTTVGFSGFGTGAKPASFGQSMDSAFAGNASTTSAFGSHNPSTTAFGKPSTPSAFGAPSTPTAFGTTAFGQKSDTGSKTAFGSSGFGSSAFGQSTTPSSTPVKPVSGQSSTSTPSAFGQPAFGTTSSPAAFGQSSFGGSTAPSAFGRSGFASSSTPNAFGAPSKPNAFTSSTTTPSAFGSSPIPSAFGSSAFTHTSTPSAFGSSSQPSVFGSSSTTNNPFGASSSSSTTSGFGAFSTPTPTASTGFSFGGFSQSKGNSNPFGNKGLGGVGLGSTNAFGQKSAFSGSAFGNAPNVGSVSPPEPSPSIDSASHSPVRDGFGFGTFESSLDQATPIARPTVPAMGDSPPASPILGARSNVGRGDDDSPPTSPIIGVKSKAKAMDDDTPPNSPPRSFGQPASAVTPKANKSTSGFIKPPTAFGSSTTEGFGAFSAPTSSKPAFGSSSKSTPSAFTKEAPLTTPQSSSPAFGKPSTPVQSTPAFGSSPFGKASTPAPAFGSSGFGKPQTTSTPIPTAFSSSASGDLKPTSPTSSTPSFGISSTPRATIFGQSSVPSGSAFFLPTKSSGGFGGFAAPLGGKETSGGFGAFTAKTSKTGSAGFGAFASEDAKTVKDGGFGGFSAAVAKTSGFGFTSGASSDSLASIFGGKDDRGDTATKSEDETVPVTTSFPQEEKVEKPRGEEFEEKEKQQAMVEAENSKEESEAPAGPALKESTGGFSKIEVEKTYDALAEGGPVKINVVTTSSSSLLSADARQVESEHEKKAPEQDMPEEDVSHTSDAAATPRPIPLPLRSVVEVISPIPEETTKFDHGGHGGDVAVKSSASLDSVKAAQGDREIAKAVPAMIPLPPDDDTPAVQGDGGEKVAHEGLTISTDAVEATDSTSPKDIALPEVGEEEVADLAVANRDARHMESGSEDEEEVATDEDEQEEEEAEEEDSKIGAVDVGEAKDEEGTEEEELAVEDSDDAGSEEGQADDAYSRSGFRSGNSIPLPAIEGISDGLLEDDEAYEDLGDEEDEEEEYEEDAEEDYEEDAESETEEAEGDGDLEDVDEQEEEESNSEDSTVLPAVVSDETVLSSSSLLPTQAAEDQSAQPLSPTPVVSTSTESSLFSRLGPAPVHAESLSPPTTDLTPPTFAFKHAARKSSPLASQPPETGSTTPDASPAKAGILAEAEMPSKPVAPQSRVSSLPAPGGLSTGRKEEVRPAEALFGNSGINTEVKEAHRIASAPLSSFFSQSKSVVTKADEASAVAPPVSSFFSTVKPEEKKVEAPAAPRPFNFFGTAAATQSMKPDKPKSAFGDGLGSGRPPVAAVTQTTASGAWGQAVAGLPQAQGQAGGTDVPPKSVDAVSAEPTFDTRVPAVQSLSSVQDLSVYSLPSRPVASAIAPKARSKATSLSAVMENMTIDMVDEIKSLKSALAHHAAYHQEMDVPNFAKVSLADLDRHQNLPFSSVSDIASIADGLIRELQGVHADNKDAEAQLADLQSQMLKTDMKRGQAEKFSKARHDPTFGKVQPERALTAGQEASQVKIRTAVQNTETKLSELENIVEGLKKQLEKAFLGTEEASSDPFEPIQRSVESIGSAIRDRSHTLDDLAARISAVRLSSSSAKMAQQSVSSQAHPSSSRPSLSASIREAPTEVAYEVSKSLASEDFWRQRFSLGKLDETRISRVGGTAAAAGTVSATKKTVSIGDHPIPYIATATPKPRIKRDVRTPSTHSQITPTSKPSLFSNLSVSFDLTQMKPSPSSGGSGSRESGRIGGGLPKMHTPAPRFGGSSAAQSASAPSSLFGGGFGVPKAAEVGKAKAPPGGFFSLTGFADK